MPTTPKGIYYPGPTFAPQLVEDQTTMGNDAMNRTDALAASSQAGPDILTTPSTYTSSPAGGDIITVTTGAASDFLLWVQFWGQVKKHATANLGVAIFIDGNQMKSPVNNAIPQVQELNDSAAITGGGFFGLVYTDRFGITGSGVGAADTAMTATTGFTSANASPVYIWGLAPGTHTLEIKYKVASGNLTLGQRYLLGGCMKGF